MKNLNDILKTDQLALKWFNMLKENDKKYLSSIIDQIIITTNIYNQIFSGFELYITGSSLNLVDRNYQDIDIMVVIPEQRLRDFRIKLLQNMYECFKNGEFNKLNEYKNDIRIRSLDLTSSLDQIIDFLNYQYAIKNQDQKFLFAKLSSANEVTRLLMDPEPELQGIKMRVEGLIASERSRPSLEDDGSAGYQYGPIVEYFLNDVASAVTKPDGTGNIQYNVQWSKSFSEGYGKLAGENNCNIYSNTNPTAAPVHLFMTTGVDHKKSMEKKDSFMIKYYSENERLKPLKILG